MDPRQLRHFVATFEGGSLGKAAESMHISQPGLSKSIHVLETSLGVVLFDRGPGGVRPTAFGRALYPRAKRILAEIRQVENERAAMTNGRVGNVTIGVARGTGFLNRVIPAATARLSDELYSVKLTVLSGVADELAHGVQIGDLDFAVAVLSSFLGQSGLSTEVLFKDRCGLFVDARHPLNNGARVSIDDLVKYCWLYSTDAASLYDALCNSARDKRLEPRLTVIDSNSVVYVVSTLIGSDFIGMLSMDSVEDEVNEGQIVELVLGRSERARIAGAATERPTGFIHRSDTSLSPIALALTEEIRRLCKQMGYPIVAGVQKRK